jgi:GH24 family phage-related lysozyme (muramidase)
VIAAAGVIGVPTSAYGVTWMPAKPTKMVVDCRNDRYIDAARLGVREFRDNASTVFERRFSCVDSVSFNIGNVEFIRKQHSRWQDGRP